MRSRRRSWLVRLAPAALVAATVVGMPTQAADAAAGCVYDGGTGVVTVTLDGLPTTVSRAAGGGGAVRVNGSPCGAATVANTETVVVTGDPTANDLLTLDWSNGLFAPGVTVEPLASVVETEVDLGGGTDHLTVVGTSGNDVLVGGAGGFDLQDVDSGSGPEADHQDLTLTGVEGLTLDLGAGHDRATLSEWAPALAVPTRMNGGPGDDVLTGGSGDDTFVATDAGETTDTGVDGYYGGDGLDTVDYSARVNGVTVDRGVSSGSGESGEAEYVDDDIERVLTGEGDDLVYGLASADLVDTGDGSDIVVPGDGDDTVTLGPGPDFVIVTGTAVDGADSYVGDLFDTLDYSDRTAALTVNLPLGDNIGQAGEGDDVTGIGNVIGGQGNDLLVGSTADNTLTGGPGNDRITGGAGTDVLNGGDGNDVFVQGALADGADTVHGDAGVDAMDYSLRTTAVVATLGGGGGGTGEADLIGSDVESLYGGIGNDVLVGNASANTLLGGSGNDTLRGMAGNDVEVGGAGTDSFYQDASANGRDTLSGGAGVDRADYLARTRAVVVVVNNVADDGGIGEKDNVRTDVENVRGGAAADKLYGSAFANLLEGAGGNDLLDGLGAADRLLCGAGRDIGVRRSGDRYTACETVR